MKSKTIKCSICKGKIDEQVIGYDVSGAKPKSVVWYDGHNAQPINNGRCCTHCNWDVVMPARVVLIKKGGVV